MNQKRKEKQHKKKPAKIRNHQITIAPIGFGKSSSALLPRLIKEKSEVKILNQ